MVFRKYKLTCLFLVLNLFAVMRVNAQHNITLTYPLSFLQIMPPAGGI